MGQPENVVNLAFPYVTWVAISLVPLVIFQSFKQFSDGLSLTKISMISTIIANIINVIINYILIYGKLGFPRLELVGAGIGTLISRISMVIIIVLIIQNNKKTKHFIKSIFSLNFSKSISKKILNLGYPSALQMMLKLVFIAGVWVWINWNELPSSKSNSS